MRLVRLTQLKQASVSCFGKTALTTRVCALSLICAALLECTPVSRCHVSCALSTASLPKHFVTGSLRVVEVREEHVAIDGAGHWRDVMQLVC